MESHEENTTSAGTQQGRRLACERCRSQKLKCEKSNIQDCCQRCRKADVQCSFGMALPPGRPRANPPPPPPPAPVSEPTTDDNDQTIIASPSYHVDQTFTFDPSANAHNNPFNDDGMIDVPFTDDVLNGYTAWSVALSGTCAGSKPPDGLMALEHLHPTLANAPDSFMMIDTHPSTPPPQPLQIHPTISPTSVRGSEILSSYKQMQAPTGSLAALVRRAADLCDKMYELRIKYHDGTHSELDAPGEFPVNMSGEVLQAANDFLTLLRCFFYEEPSGRSTPSLISNTSSRTNTSPILPEQPRRVIFDADRPAALTLIASYQRLLDLYLLYYLSVHEYIRNTEPAWRRNQPIWNDLNVGGASLGEFGDLHIKLIMQATARVLEDIEGALGLSQACRVSCPSAVEGDGGGHGVLGTIVTTRFVEQCIAEGFTGGGSEHGQGVIARIREVAASLTAALDPPGGR